MTFEERMALTRELELREAPWSMKEAIAEAIFYRWPFCWLPGGARAEDKGKETIQHMYDCLYEIRHAPSSSYDLVL
jgi:hypothetical protein